MKQHILIVEDDPLTASMLKIFLTEFGEISIAGDSASGFEMAERMSPDLILMDIGISGADGLETCRKLKANAATADIPVIFVTSLDEGRDEEAAFEAGGVDYIRKPVNPYTTRARVKTHLELKAVRDQLASMAYRDGLTGILNRRGFDERLLAETDRANRAGLDLTVGLIDVDYFKRFNDRYGHQAGDDCLRRVASALAAGIRSGGDIVARYGGEEFAIVLTETSPDQARNRAESLRRAIQDLAIENAGSSVADVVTVSVGLACLPGDTPTRPAMMIEEADAALYEAKNDGRNQVRLREPAVRTPELSALSDGVT